MRKSSIAEIKQELSSLTGDDLDYRLSLYGQDERKGVINLVNAYKKKKEALKSEMARMERMKEFERRYGQFKYIAGIDEVGRGPLAGPVVAGAVILPKDCDILYINDSKQLSADMREAIYEEIVEKAIAFGVGITSPGRIDEINILQATYEAMRKAISILDPRPDMLLVDAVHIPNVDIRQVGIIAGDARSASIAAGSILAKVTRDRMMMEYDKSYPEYKLASNKGYGSKAHIDAIIEFGPSPIHRNTFLKDWSGHGEKRKTKNQVSRNIYQ